MKKAENLVMDTDQGTIESEEIEGLLKINMKKPDSSPVKKLEARLHEEDGDKIGLGQSRQLASFSLTKTIKLSSIREIDTNIRPMTSLLGIRRNSSKNPSSPPKEPLMSQRGGSIKNSKAFFT
jgi:hypothetical protein